MQDLSSPEDTYDTRTRIAPRNRSPAVVTAEPDVASFATVDAALADLSAIRSAYQPVVDLITGDVVGYEALARWPDLPGADPDLIFRAAADRGSLAELDWACRIAAMDGATAAGMDRATALFVNVEPNTASAAPRHIRADLTDSVDRLTIVLELTERSLTADPRVLLAVVETGRRAGCLIALDDVGVHPDTVTMLEFVAPDIIKLDRQLVQHDPDAAQARIIAAVRAHAEAGQVTVLAEGIETEEHRQRALALGATLGQGWLFGRPGPLPASMRSGLHAAPSAVAACSERSTGPIPVPSVPSDLFARSTPLVGKKSLIKAMARQIEDYAATTNESLALMSTFQHAQWFRPSVADRYSTLARKHPFVAAVGIGLDGEPAPGVRGAGLEPGERFVNEWTITAVGQHFFSALIARDLGDRDCPDEDRRFEFLHTHDRRVVVAAARSLMRRILPT